MFQPHFSHKDAEVVREERTRFGIFEMIRYHVRHRLFVGGWSGVMARTCAHRSPAVVVIPYDPVLDAVVMVEQFRIGALADEKSPWLLEWVAGMMDDDDIFGTAERELKEETGLEGKDWTAITTYWVTPGASSERVHLYAAKVDASKALEVAGLDHEDEDIRVHVVPYVEAKKALDQGLINNSATLIGMQWLVLHREAWALQ